MSDLCACCSLTDVDICDHMCFRNFQILLSCLSLPLLQIQNSIEVQVPVLELIALSVMVHGKTSNYCIAVKEIYSDRTVLHMISGIIF